METSEDGSAQISFMNQRPEHTWAYGKTEKIEAVSLDQILIGPLSVAYAKTGIVVHGLPEVKTKWGEYIKANDDSEN